MIVYKRSEIDRYLNDRPQHYTGSVWLEGSAYVEYLEDGVLMYCGDVNNDISNIKANYPDLYVEVMAKLLASK